ncbi:MAG: gliding motility-associated ABC transporter substrate-binding protein GldG [Bacteroidales bacterium]|nr:gliding motility-associated ABC transporter substrate-binding protein GldG [Bacteroidales bacterium]
MKNTGSNKHYLKLLFSLALVLLAAFILNAFFFRLDLTSEKRYTISDFSKESLMNLKDIVYVKVYLEGDLNIPFRKMKQSIQETLDEFKVYAEDNLQYEFVNPFGDEDPAIQEDVINELFNRGLQPTNIYSSDREGGSAEKIVFPGAIINYRGVEVPLNLLNNNPGAGAEENINNSVQALEFEFIRIINSLSAESTEKIAFIEGHGELDEYQVGDLTRELAWYFQVDRGKINGQPGILDDYKAVIIAKPVEPFNEQDKFVLDQYIMKGGKVLWFIDMVSVSLDSLNEEGFTIALINQLNIEDLLFRYGVRINPVLLQDIQCNIIPVNMALPGNNPNFQPAPWLYYPLLSAPYAHPVTRNLNMIKSEFVTDIDTIGSRKEIRKTVMLSTSVYTKRVNAPAMVSLKEIETSPVPDQFNEHSRPVAVMLEGSFESAFRNRMLEDLLPAEVYEYNEFSAPTAMLVVSDGDIIRNDVRITAQGKEVFPLGLDRYTQVTFGNKEFIINAVHFLTGHEDLINLRSRELTLRMLDKSKISEEGLFWVLFNTVLPPAIIILAGLLYAWYRKHRFTTR